ncbi:MAG: hypothetical protein O3A00_20865, partial [Planctomycetota bacterium]|nr:hypothetical protein [Planctomycetota bacterium]
MCAIAEAEQYPGPVMRQTGYMQPMPNGVQVTPDGTYIVPDQSAGVASLEGIVGQRVAAPFGPRMGFTSQLDDSMGNTGNMYSVFAFLPKFVDSGNALLFATLEGSVTEYGDGLFNFGAGFREYDASRDRIYTAEGHFIGDGGHAKTFYAAGFALQSLGRYTDHQLTGNFVVGDDQVAVSSLITGSAFSGNNIVLTRTRTNEQAYSIVEYMWGGRLPFLGQYGVSGHVGGYYTWNPEADEAVGVKVRSDVQVTQDFSAGFTYTNDPKFGQTAFASITMMLPDGKPKSFLRPTRVYDRLGERIYHNHRISTANGSEQSGELAINPADNQPFFIVFVDPNRTDAGNGTFETPFNTLEASRLANNANTDIHFVFRRSDNTSTNLGVMAPFQLFDNQQFLSDGVQNTIVARQGSFPLPFNPLGTDTLATIFNETNTAAGSVLSLANNNTVSGFRISGADAAGTTFGQGITSSGAISGFSVTQNEFVNYTNGLVLGDVGNGTGAVGLLDNNTFTGTVGTAINGAVVATTTPGATLALSLQNNTATGNGSTMAAPGFGIGLSVTAGAGTTINANNPTGSPSTGIIGNTATGNGTGIFLGTTGTGIFNTVIDGNTATGNTNTNSGFRAEANGGTMTLSQVINNNWSNNTGNGGVFLASNGGVLSVAIFGDNTVSGNQANGLLLSANGIASMVDINIGSVVDPAIMDSVAQPNIITQNGATSGDGIRVTVGTGGTVRGRIVNNTIGSSATGNSISFMPENTGGVIDFGNVSAGRYIYQNQLTANSLGSGFFVNSTVTSVSRTDMFATFLNNSFSNNPNGGININMAGPNNIPPTPTTHVNGLNNSLTLLVSGSEDLNRNGVLDAGEDFDGDGVLTTTFSNQAITGNGLAGIAASLTGNAYLNVAIQNLDISNSVASATVGSGSGIFFNREDTTLLEATIADVNLLTNANDGLTVRLLGNEPNDPNQPFRDRPNTVNLIDVTANMNQGSGISFRGFADSAIVGTLTRVTATNNQLNGVRVQMSEDSAFGDPTGGPMMIPPPGQLSVFDGLTLNNNQQSGVFFQADDNARIVGQIRSDTRNTTINNNAVTSGHGVEMLFGGGQSDVRITGGPTFTTTIADNGNTNGSNGIDIDISGTANSILSVQSTTIRGAISNTVTGADGDGINVDIQGNSAPTIVFGGSGVGNFILNNEGDGVQIAVSNGTSRPIINLVENVIGGNASGNGGNGGNGVLLDVDGGVGTGVDASASGPVITATFSGNEISENVLDGVHITLDGAMGTRDRESGPAPANVTNDLSSITFNNLNTISSNGEHGIFYSADAGFLENRRVLLTNIGFPPGPNSMNNMRDPEFDATGTAITDGSQAFYAPTIPEFAALNTGTLGSSSAYAIPWVNLRTANNTRLTIDRNTIQNNGTGTVQGEGVFVTVGTNTYLAADMRNNVFGGNLGNDLRTESVNTAGNPMDLGNDTGPTQFDPVSMTNVPQDEVFLDDSSQFDLRFARNTGNQISANSAGASYNNDDPAKRPAGVSMSTTPRTGMI